MAMNSNTPIPPRNRLSGEMAPYVYLPLRKLLIANDNCDKSEIDGIRAQIELAGNFYGRVDLNCLAGSLPG